MVSDTVSPLPVQPFLPIQPVNVRDVRMVQRRQHLRFARKAREPIGVVRERFRENLQRHVAIEPRVARAIHLAHPSGAERRKDLVWTEDCSGCQGQL